MATVTEHYNNLLADYYSWMFGNTDQKIKENINFFEQNKISPQLSKIALDLGAGSGFQSIALAKKGYKVMAFDICEKLLNELKNQNRQLDIKIFKKDLKKFKKFISENIELIVCMGDTLPHLESLDEIESLIKDVFDSLEEKGKFIITFRDLTTKLEDTNRFIPVKSDKNTIFTCFLEYEEKHVKVHDLIYVNQNNQWVLNKSFYKKLIITPTWIKSTLEKYNFKTSQSSEKNGMLAIVAEK